MALKLQTYLYEVLLRFDASGLRGAHQIRVEAIMDGTNQKSLTELPAEAIDPETLTSLVGETSAKLIAQVGEQQKEIARLQSALESVEAAARA